MPGPGWWAGMRVSRCMFTKNLRICSVEKHELGINHCENSRAVTGVTETTGGVLLCSSRDYCGRGVSATVWRPCFSASSLNLGHAAWFLFAEYGILGKELDKLKEGLSHAHTRTHTRNQNLLVLKSPRLTRWQMMLKLGNDFWVKIRSKHAHESAVQR